MVRIDSSLRIGMQVVGIKR